MKTFCWFVLGPFAGLTHVALRKRFAAFEISEINPAVSGGLQGMHAVTYRQSTPTT